MAPARHFVAAAYFCFYGKKHSMKSHLYTCKVSRYLLLRNQIIHDLMTVISLLSPIGMYWYMEDRMYLNML